MLQGLGRVELGFFGNHFGTLSRDGHEQQSCKSVQLMSLRCIVLAERCGKIVQGMKLINVA